MLNGTSKNDGDGRHGFKAQLPESFNFGRDVVDKWAHVGDKEALVWCNEAGEERRFSFADMARLSNQFANLLARQGLRKGDRIVIMLPRIPEWQISMIACLKVGAIPIPCIEMLTESDIAYRVQNSGAVGAVTTVANTRKFQHHAALRICVAVGEPVPNWVPFTEYRHEPGEFVCADLKIEEPALMYYTSGSSGKPKGVLHATRGLFTWPTAVEHWQALTRDDVKWCTADTGWSKAGTGVLFGPWSLGATVFFYDGRFDPRQRLHLIAKYGVTVFCAAATEFRHLIQLPPDEYNVKSLRLAVSAGESVNSEVIKRWYELSNVLLLEAFGQTETLLTIINSPRVETRLGSMGRATPGTESTIITSENELAKDGEIGQVALKLPNRQFMLGYWNDSGKTEESMTTIDGQRYWLTGDFAYRDADGYFYYAGRADDIISSAGYRIGPNEVESALIDHPSVVECAVVGAPDSERGEVVKAYVVLRSGYYPSDELTAELQDHVKRLTAPYKYPRRVEFIDSLPKNAAGKVLRRVLRDQEVKKISDPNASHAG